MDKKTLGIIITAKDEASKTISGVSDSVTKSTNEIKNASKLAIVAIAALGVAIGVDSVKDAAAYQSSLSQLAQASSANGKQMSEMSKLARQLGADTSLAGVTASDAAATMLELSKAGLSVNDTMAASRGVMSLAKAGNMEFADAAVLAASALNAFGLKGKDATKVADALAAGANASQANLNDLGLGLQQSATVAKQFGLNINETVTALSLFANNGIKGSDAGTSLKTMLISLAKPSKEAASAMKDIGFTAYDAQGNFVGLREMSDRLAKSMTGLTEEQKQSTLATIFGTDAFRAASVLAGNAGTSYDSMSKSVGKAGAAQDAAKAQLGDYDRATEGLSNTISELKLKIGEYLLPTMTRMTQYAANNLIPTFNTGTEAFKGQYPVITMLGIGLSSYAAIAGTVALSTKAISLAQAGLNMIMAANPYYVVAAAAAGIITAYIGVLNQTNNNKNATDRLNEARRAEVTAADLAKDAENRLSGAKLSEEGATLAVESAQRRFNETVAQYGPNSLEARQAAYDLKVSQDNLKKAHEDVKRAVDESLKAQKEVGKAKADIIAVNREISDSASGVAGSYKSLSATIRDARSEAAKSGGSSLKAETNAVFGLPKGFASGGFTGRGGANDVAGVVHRGEYVLPKSQVDQSTGQPKSISNSNTYQFNAPISFSSADAVDRFLTRTGLNMQKELGNYGVGV